MSRPLPAFIYSLPLALLCMTASCLPTSAATLNVPAQYSTIQAAINAAANGDTVLIADGTYTGPGNVDVDFGGKNLTVTSQNGAAKTIIDCGGSSTVNHRGFYLHSGETNAVISGLTVENGYEYGYGGGIFDNGDGLTVQRCVLKSNTAVYGGGIYEDNSSGAISVTNCAFISNAANTYGQGGGIYNVSENVNTISVTNCTFTNNTAQTGSNGIGDSGGICNMRLSNGGQINLTNDVLYGDTGGEVGGAVVTLSYCDIQGGYYGGYVPVGDIDADPLFVNSLTNLHLQGGSPCLGAGTASGAPTTDITGVYRPSPPSIGAYEERTQTTTTLNSSLNPSQYGQQVTLTATVANGYGESSGNVIFSIDGVAQPPVPLKPPVGYPYYPIAVFATTSLSDGAHTIIAAYSGDSSFSPSTSPSFTQAVDFTPYYVSPSGSDSNPGTRAAPKLTIQAAINSMLSADSLIIEDGTYTGPGNVDIDFGGKSLTVTSQNGPNTTIIDCQGGSNANHRGLVVVQA